jgi:hypothetical protein
MGPDMLNGRRFIDVVFESRSGDPIDPLSINGDEMVISGTAVNNAKLRAGRPIKLFDNTYRYFFVEGDLPADPPTDPPPPMFINGELTITFAPRSFRAGTGTQAIGNLLKAETITLDASQASTADTDKEITLGPLALEKPSVSFEDLSFGGGKLSVTVALSLQSARLNFGDSSASTKPSGSLTGVRATFDLGVGFLPGDFSVSSSGKFSLNVAQLEVVVPNVVEGRAQGIVVQYDPAADKTQELVRIDRATLTFPKFGVSGEIAPFDPDPKKQGDEIPGLVVRGDGFTLGQAELSFGPANGIQLGSILQFDDLRVGVTNFRVNFDPANVVPAFDGSIYFASGGARFFPGSTLFNASILDRDAADDVDVDGAPNTEAMRADLEFESGEVKGLVFEVDTLNVNVGIGTSLGLTLNARDFQLNTDKSPLRPDPGVRSTDRPTPKNGSPLR